MRRLHVIMGELTVSRARLAALRVAVPPNAAAIAVEEAAENRLVAELNVHPMMAAPPARPAAVRRPAPAPAAPVPPPVVRPANGGGGNGAGHYLGMAATWRIGTLIVLGAVLLLVWGIWHGGQWLWNHRPSATAAFNNGQTVAGGVQNNNSGTIYNGVVRCPEKCDVQVPAATPPAPGKGTTSKVAPKKAICECTPEQRRGAAATLDQNR